LMSFLGGVDLASLVLQELRTCEVIRKNPHPNLATFYRCKISDDGRVSGLCFERYTEKHRRKSAALALTLRRGGLGSP
jgi:hypothetical protein